MQPLKIFSLFLLTVLTMAQTNIETLWKEYRKTQIEDKPKTQAELLEKILKVSKEQKLISDYYKAFFLKLETDWKLTLEQEDNKIFFTTLYNELKTTQPPLKNFVYFAAAKLLEYYFQRHQYEILDRTHANLQPDPFNPETWDAAYFVKTINEYLLKALEDEEILKNEPAEKYEKILKTYGNENSKMEFTPTLFDVFVFNAIDIWSRSAVFEETEIYSYKIEDPNLFCTVPEFLKYDLANIPEDKRNNLYYSLLYFQKQLQFHHEERKDFKPTIFTEVKRLDFIKNYIRTEEDKDKLYLKALDENEKLFPEGEPFRFYFREKILWWYYNKGDHFRPTLYNKDAPERKYLIKVAKEAESILQKEKNLHPIIKNNLEYFLKQIKERKSLDFSVQGAFLPGQGFPVEITYLNYSKAYLKFYKISYKDFLHLNEKMRKHYGIERVEILSQLLKDKTPARKYEIDLKNPGDYLEHSIEFPVEKLPEGFYLVVFTDKEYEPADKSRLLQYKEVITKGFWVTPLNYRYDYDSDKQQFRLQVLHRENNAPVKNADVQVHITYARYSKKSPVNFSGKTDKNGYIYYNLPKEKSSSIDKIYFKMETSDKKHLYEDEERVYSLEKHKPVFKNHNRIYLFTDRSIYRPGQVVYFKGILLQAEGKNKHVPASGEEVTMELVDANYKVVQELTLTTNDYGSFFGSFVIPKDRLPGSWSIRSSSRLVRRSYHTIRVEEYKIPKFFVELKAPEKDYKVGEVVTVKGIVRSYAGVPLENTKVTVNIYRSVFFPHRWWWFRGYDSEKVFLVTKHVKTDAKGEFEVSFKLVADPQTSAKLKPVLNYEIIATATDESGETHSQTLNLSASYDPFIIYIKPEKDSLASYKYKSLKIVTENASGKPVKTSGKILIYKLKTPTNILTSRPGNLPDIAWTSYEEFKKIAPDFPYLDENIPETWKQEKQITSFSFQSGKEYSLEKIKQAGVYKIVAEISFKGKTYKQEKLLIFNDFKNKKLAYPQRLVTYSNNHKSFKPGEKIFIEFMSSIKDFYLIYKYASFETKSQEYFVKVSGGFHRWEYLLQEKDKGNLNFIYGTFLANRVKSGRSSFLVPWHEKKLQYSWKRFRDKLLPGEETEFEITIKDYQGKPVSAEFLVNMYNQALDSYVPHAWRFYTPSYYNYFPDLPLVRENSSKYLFSFSEPFFVSINRKNLGVPKIFVNNIWNYYYYEMFESAEYNAFGADDFGADDFGAPPPRPKMRIQAKTKKSAPAPQGHKSKVPPPPKEEQTPPREIQIRKDLKETAFFYPNLYTDKDGNVVIKFKAPEALSTWKLQALAHTKSLQAVLLTETLKTQKEIMIEPFLPRFLREGDEIIITARVSTPEPKKLQGNSKLEILDPVYEKAIRGIEIIPMKTDWKLSEDKQNTIVKWKVKLPADLASRKTILMFRTYAWTQDKQFSDGEQNLLPVLSNRKLITEALPITISENGTHQFTFESVKKVFNSPTAKPYSYTFEYTPNPIWYAIQSLPYLMEFPHECYEQMFNRLYANSIAYNIMRNNPVISRVIKIWQNYQPEALLSKLEKNRELKQLLLEETPWLFQAEKESEQKRRLALLMDFNKMSQELTTIVQKLEKGQHPSGGFPWFDGFKPSEFVTRYIVAGFGRLQHLGILNSLDENSQNKIQKILPPAIRFIDKAAEEYYRNLKRWKSFDPTKFHLSYYIIYYMYARSFFLDKKIPNQNMFDFYIYQMENYWNRISDFSLRAMLAVALHRWKPKSKTPALILESFSEYLINNEQVGCRFKNVYRGWNWYQNSLTTEVFTIEAFWEINKEKYKDKIACMKQWILNNRRLNNWETTIRTSDVIYIFLLTSPKVLQKEPQFTFYIGNEEVRPENQEAGTGYFKKVWKGGDIKPEMANIKIVAKDVNITSWGAVFLQYFENLENVKAHNIKDLSLKREYFKVYTDEKGEKMQKITAETPLNVGDEVVVRILISVGRNMSYVHIKDTRGATLEPKDKLSGYQNKAGVGYYMAIKDASVNFFIDYLPAGNYTLEYRLYVTHAGSFSSGISVIQNMYAPEFTSHTAGQKFKVQE